MSVEPRLLSVKDAAFYMAMSLPALRKRIFDRSIGGIVKIKGRLFFDRKKLDDFIDAAEIKINGGRIK